MQAATELRRAQTLFGGATKETTGRAQVVVEKVTDNSRGHLLGGVVDGIEQGVEMERIIPALPKVRLQVTKADISQSEYQIIGPPQTLSVGDHFEQVTWVAKTEPDLTVWIPPSVTPTLRKAITTDLEQNKGQIFITDIREKANYELSGRFDPAAKKFEYSWLLRVAVTDANKKIKATLKEPAVPLSLPPVTNWIVDDGSGSAAGGLKMLALKLAKIRRLTNLSSPIPMGVSKLPYRLEVRNLTTRRTLSSGEIVRSTDLYAHVLKRVGNAEQAAPEFFAYLVSIDNNGTSAFTEYPIEGSGANSRPFDPLAAPDEITLFKGSDNKGFNLVEPFGTDILILILYDKKLSNAASVLDFSGVQGPTASTTKGGGNPLTDLFNDFGMAITAKGESATWAVQHLILSSVK